MKKWLIALLTLLALSLSVAFAAEANDITEDCKFKVQFRAEIHADDGQEVYLLLGEQQNQNPMDRNYRAGGQANCRALCLLRQHA